MEKSKKFYEGQSVIYIAHESAAPEHGTVSTVVDLPDGRQKVWVRYTTGSTSALTPTDKLF